MPFDPRTEDLYLEVEAARKETANHVGSALDIWKRYAGRWYREDWEDNDPDPENHTYAFMSNILPQLHKGEPQVKVEPARIVGHKTLGEAQEDGINSWVLDFKFKKRIERVVADLLVLRGISVHYLEEDGRWSRGSVRPAIKPIRCADFFCDSLATSNDPDEMEFMGHDSWLDLDVIMADPRVPLSVKEMLVPGGSAEDQGREPQNKAARSSGMELGRRRIQIWNVWLREKNELRVLTPHSRVEELYPPRPYYGDPKAGPYQLYDAYPMDGHAWPVSPLVAVQDQSGDLNIHARAMGRAAARRKSIGLVEASNPDLGDKLAAAEDGEILPAQGISGNHVVIELGGVTQDQYTYVEYIRDRLDRISGMTATVQGSVGEADTATEAEIAASALDNRTGYLKEKVLEAHEGSLRRIGWYLWHTEGIVIPVNRRDPYSGEPIEGLFFGGPSPTDEGARWDDFELKIRLFTVQRESPLAHRQRMMGFFQIFMQIAQMAPQMPWVRWLSILRDMSEAWQIEDGEEWLIPEMFGGFSQPPQFPPSAVLGPAEIPTRGTPNFNEVGGNAADFANMQNGGGQFNTGQNFGASGQAAGPRPTGQQGGNRMRVA